MINSGQISASRSLRAAARFGVIGGVFLLGTLATVSTAADPDGSTRDLARRILDETISEAERKALIAERTDESADLMQALVAGLKPGTKEEYRRIPWIWRVTVAAGKRNKSDEIRGVLAASMPRLSEPLHDWQAVVIGGGIINGVTLSGAWPQDTLDPLFATDSDLATRWIWTLDQSRAMADDEQTPIPTRYDALRIIGLRSWDESGGQLFKYLVKGTDDELQQGAIGGLGDMRSPCVPQALLSGWPHYTPGNRKFVVTALLRDRDRAKALDDAIREGRVAVGELSPEQSALLKRLIMPSSQPETPGSP